MKQKNFLIGIVFLSLLVYGCDTGVETSKEPGTLRVTIRADYSDTSITVANKTFSVSDNDIYNIKMFQAKAYKDSIYYVLFKDLETFNQEDRSFNILEKENSSFKKHVAFESRLPEGSYNKLQFGITASSVKIGNMIIPVALPEGESLLMDIYRSFSINSNRVTEINLVIKPFQSVTRYQDSFLFTRKLEVESINIL